MLFLRSGENVQNKERFDSKKGLGSSVYKNKQVLLIHYCLINNLLILIKAKPKDKSLFKEGAKHMQRNNWKENVLIFRWKRMLRYFMFIG